MRIPFALWPFFDHQQVTNCTLLFFPFQKNPAVLWRILQGEMPLGLNPKIWWLELSLNDLRRTQRCTHEEVVVLGILHVVLVEETTLQQKADAKIVSSRYTAGAR
jgi:hypothetical protein